MDEISSWMRSINFATVFPADLDRAQRRLETIGWPGSTSPNSMVFAVSLQETALSPIDEDLCLVYFSPQLSRFAPDGRCAAVRAGDI
jgi:hypothetical protein